jgi:hypothetical protein
MEGMDAMRDKRFEERDRRRRNNARDARKDHGGNLPDLRDRIATPAAESLADLRDTLVKEKAARDARIQRILNEPARPLTGVAPQANPLEFED